MAKNGGREERLYRNLTLKRGSSRPLTVVLGLHLNVSSHDPFSVSRGQRVLWGVGWGVGAASLQLRADAMAELQVQ